jgi:hypothetical protein
MQTEKLRQWAGKRAWRYRAPGANRPWLSWLCVFFLLSGLHHPARAALPVTIPAPPSASLALAFGDTIQASLDAPGELDSFSFSAAAGDKVLVRMSKLTGATLWPEIKIFSGALQICQAYSTASAEIASCSLSADGEYTLQAKDHLTSETGAYALFIQRLNAPGGASAIAFGQTLAAELISAAEMDAFTFSASAGDIVLARFSPPASAELWPELRLYGPDGTRLCEKVSTDVAEIAACSLPSDGSYTLLALDHFGLDGSPYHLYLQRLNAPGGASAIAFGQTLAAGFATAAEMDAFTFSASAGDIVLARFNPPAGADLWPELRLYGPDGSLLCSHYLTSYAEIAACSLPGAGSYTLLALDHFGLGSSPYHLYLQRLNNPGASVPIASGQTITAQIAAAAEMDAYTFNARAGDVALARMQCTSGDQVWPELRLYGPDGSLLCSHSLTSYAEISACPLPSDGRYLILARDHFGQSPCDYSIFFFNHTVYLPLLR